MVQTTVLSVSTVFLTVLMTIVAALASSPEVGSSMNTCLSGFNSTSSMTSSMNIYNHKSTSNIKVIFLLFNTNNIVSFVTYNLITPIMNGILVFALTNYCENVLANSKYGLVTTESRKGKYQIT